MSTVPAPAVPFSFLVAGKAFMNALPSQAAFTLLACLLVAFSTLVASQSVLSGLCP